MPKLSPFLIALKQGAINKKPAKVFAYYYEKSLGENNPVFFEPILEDEKHVINCECELCKGYIYMHSNVELYTRFYDYFIEVIMEDENRFRMQNHELADLIYQRYAC